MGPGMDGELVTEHVFSLEDVLTGDGTRSDDEKGRFQILRRKIVEQTRSIGGWSIIVTVNRVETGTECRKPKGRLTSIPTYT